MAKRQKKPKTEPTPDAESELEVEPEPEVVTIGPPASGTAAEQAIRLARALDDDRKRIATLTAREQLAELAPLAKELGYHHASFMLSRLGDPASDIELRVPYDIDYR